MRGFYSKDKKKQFEDNLKQEQEKYEANLKISKSKNTKLTIEIQNLKDHSKLIEAQKRLKALQKEEQQRLKHQDHRDYYINVLRKQDPLKEATNLKNIQALDLGVSSKIPKPSSAKKQIFPEENSKIPKPFKLLHPIPEDNLPWKKGDLLDSLDLSNTNLKKFFQNKPKPCDSPGKEQKDDRTWLKENFRESINEWAPKKIDPVPELKPTKRVVQKKPRFAGKIEEKLEEFKENKPVKKVQFNMEKIPEKASTRYTNSDLDDEVYSEPVFSPVARPKIQEKEKIGQNANSKPPLNRPSKFVAKIKSIPESKEEFLSNELKCLNEEEAKLEASLARLDIKSLRLRHQADIESLNIQAQRLEDSLRNAQSKLPEKQNVSPNIDEIHEVAELKSKELPESNPKTCDAQSVLSEEVSKDQGPRARSVTSGQSVRSGYSVRTKIPISKVKLKVDNKEKIRVNPNVDLKTLFCD